jgi:hypothetical protein
LGTEAQLLELASVALLLAATCLLPILLARVRNAAWSLTRAHGLLLSRRSELDALGQVRRWYVDPRLLLLPGPVEVVSFGDVGASTLLPVALALLEDSDAPEARSIRTHAEKTKLARLRPAALSREHGVYRGTVAQKRWFMGPRGALEGEKLELDPSLGASLQFLEEGATCWLIGRPDAGALGAIRVPIVLEPRMRDAARALEATLLPGLPDALRGAIAKEANLRPHGPPLTPKDASLIAKGSPKPSAGLRITVLPVAPAELPEASRSAKLARSSAVILPALIAGLKQLRRRRTLALIALVVGPPAWGAMLFFSEELRPLLVAPIPVVALLLTLLAAKQPKIERPGPPPEETQSDVEILMEEDEEEPEPVDVDLGSMVVPAKKDE